MPLIEPYLSPYPTIVIPHATTRTHELLEHESSEMFPALRFLTQETPEPLGYSGQFRLRRVRELRLSPPRLDFNRDVVGFRFYPVALVSKVDCHFTPVERHRERGIILSPSPIGLNLSES